MCKLKETFLTENRGKNIKIIFTNGYQLRGKLIDYDEESISIIAPAYHYSNPALIPHACISAYICE